ncbi:MAG: alpha/beta hydrolase family protein [Sphaerochaetaceae bacterium]|jgi:S-formylglutathione hydrolase FrmB|nr:alpha/beta hydrolase family protein [Sphaerochaetaceae bacterium]
MITNIEFNSKCLHGKSITNAMIPDAFDSSTAKVLYLLHGYNGNRGSWLDNTHILQYVGDKNLLIVMPDADNSYYCNLPNGKRYWDYIAIELPAAIEQKFNITLGKTNFFVAGLSMGGYGALKLAFSYPLMIAAAASFSGAVDINKIYDMDDSHKERFDGLFGSRQGFLESPDYLQNLINPQKNFPRILITCGTSDFLYQSNLEFMDYLKQKKITADFYTTEGAAHTWDYWDSMLLYAITWMDL